MVEDLASAERALRQAGVDIVPDDQSINGQRRIYVRDHGENRIEIAEKPSIPAESDQPERTGTTYQRTYVASPHSNVTHHNTSAARIHRA